jgi:DNA-binding GntR family transcriptional regulator
MIEELRDVRIALEGCVAERAALRRTAAHLQAVQQIYDEMDAHVEADETGAYLRSNFAFHTAIYKHGASELTLAIRTRVSISQRRSTQTVWMFENSYRPKLESSRPNPLFLTPPTVTRGSDAT